VALSRAGFLNLRLQELSHPGALSAACAGASLAAFRMTPAPRRGALAALVPERAIMELCGWSTRSVFDRYRIVAECDLAEGLGKLAAGQR